MFTIDLRRSGAILAGSALLAGGLAMAGPLAPALADSDVNAPTTAAVSWLEGELNANNLLGPDATPDVTATIDFGLGLYRTGANADVLARVKTGVDGALAGYIGTAGDASKASRVAKAAAFYAEVGETPTAQSANLYGADGRLEEQINDTTGALGDQSLYTDYFNQASAVFALDSVASPATNLATEYLLAGQCASGGWGYTYKVGEDTVCEADTETTSVVLPALNPQSDDTDVVAALAKGATWLESQQAADGSYGLTDFTPANVISTALAVRALDDVATAPTAPAAIAKATAWVRKHQLTGFSCDRALAAETGAITYSDKALADELPTGLTDRARAIRATAQSFPALAFTPATGVLAISAPRFVKAGSTVTVKTAGLAPGQRACAALASTSAAVIGDSQPNAAIKVPAGTKSYSAVVKAPGSTTAATPVTALAAKKLTVLRRSASVKAGGTQIVRVTGLVRGERVVVRYGTKVVIGVANNDGVYRTSIKVGRAKGTKTVVARGQFDTRRGSVKFRVR